MKPPKRRREPVKVKKLAFGACICGSWIYHASHMEEFKNLFWQSDLVKSWLGGKPVGGI